MKLKNFLFSSFSCVSGDFSLTNSLFSVRSFLKNNFLKSSSLLVVPEKTDFLSGTIRFLTENWVPIIIGTSVLLGAGLLYYYYSSEPDLTIALHSPSVLEGESFSISQSSAMVEAELSKADVSFSVLPSESFSVSSSSLSVLPELPKIVLKEVSVPKEESFLPHSSSLELSMEPWSEFSWDLFKYIRSIFQELKLSVKEKEVVLERMIDSSLSVDDVVPELSDNVSFYCCVFNNVLSFDYIVLIRERLILMGVDQLDTEELANLMSEFSLYYSFL
jgi:hypothetical protein